MKHRSIGRSTLIEAVPAVVCVIEHLGVVPFKLKFRKTLLMWRKVSDQNDVVRVYDG